MPNGAFKVVLGICGGIAAVKIPSLIRLLRKDNIEIKVVITPNAASLVSITALQTLSANPVYRDGSTDFSLEHVELAKWADYLIICPATANTIAKIAHGIADNLLTTLSLCFGDRIIVVPAMNTAMWQNSATRNNIAILKERNIKVLPVDSGELACDAEGEGRMISPQRIAEFVRSLRLPKFFGGKKILISSGPTIEPIDPVRVLTNRSSGKMGAELARAAIAMGAEVTVVSGPSEYSPPLDAKIIQVKTAAEMREAMLREFSAADAVIMAAAVSDFKPRFVAQNKIDRNKIRRLNIELVPNSDILMELGVKKQKQFIVGFALETEPGLRRAEQKMHRKKCDMMIVNMADQSIGLDSIALTILYARKQPPDYIPSVTKTKAAEEILLRMARCMGLTN